MKSLKGAMNLWSILQLGPLMRCFRQRVESQETEMKLEDSVRTLAYASELVLMKLRWLLPSAKMEEEPEDEALQDAAEMTVATAVTVMDLWEVAAAARAVEDRMKASARTFTRGYAPSHEYGRRLEIARIEPADLELAMRAVEARTGPKERTLVVPRWSFVTHLRDFWREVRRLSARGMVMRFSRFLGATKQEAILNFLAFLELIKRRRLFARQLTLFGDIEFSTSKDRVGEEGKEP